MTEQQYNQPIQLDAIDRLNNQLEQVQVLHEEALRDLQENEGKLIDRTAYHARRKLLTEAHEEASNAILQQIAETREATRKELALNLRYEGKTEAEKQGWAESVRLVEGANSISQQEELVHRALRWNDKALARALCWKFGGQPDYKGMVEVLAGVDERVKAVWAFERKHGVYAKKNTSQAWAGFQTYQRQPGQWSDVVDIPGRPDHLQPRNIKEVRRKEWEKRNK
jgi:hypothetical protein